MIIVVAVIIQIMIVITILVLIIVIIILVLIIVIIIAWFASRRRRCERPESSATCAGPPICLKKTPKTKTKTRKHQNKVSNIKNYNKNSNNTQGGQKFGPHSVMAWIPPYPLRILTARLSQVSG